MRRILALGGLAWSIAAVPPAATAAPPDVSTDRTAVENASRAWLMAFNARDLPAYASFLDDAYLGTDDGEISGRRNGW